MNTIANNCKVWLWDWRPDLAEWEAPRTKAPLFSDDLVPSKTLSLPSFRGTGSLNLNLTGNLSLSLSLDWQFCKKGILESSYACFYLQYRVQGKNIFKKLIASNFKLIVGPYSFKPRYCNQT